MGCFLPAFNPDVWPPSNASRRGTVATGSARGLKTWPTGCRLWHNGLFFTGVQSGRLAALKPLGCFLPPFNPDVWPPSNPSRRGTVATGSARGFKTWPTGCRLWHNYRLSIRTFGRPQTLPGGVRLPLALLGASKLGFSPFGQALAHWFGRPQTLPGRVRLHPAATASAGASTGTVRLPLALLGASNLLFTVSGRLWHNGLCFNAWQSGRLATLKPFPAGYGCHWLQALAQWAVFYRLSIRTFGRPQTLPGGVRLPLALLGASKLGPLAAGFGTMGCFLPAFNPDVWPPSNPSRRGTVATGSARGLKTWPTGCRLWHNGLFFCRLSIRTFGRPQTLPGGVRLPLALLGASKLGFSPFGQALAHWAVF